MKDLLAIALILAVGFALGILAGIATRHAGIPFSAGASVLIGFAWGFVAVQVAIHRFGRFRWGGPR